MGRTATGPWSDVAIPSTAAAREDDGVQVIASSRAVRPPLGAVVIGALVGGGLLIGGLFLAWVAFATPVFTGLTPRGVRLTPSEIATGGFIWAFTLVAPPSFAIVGVFRLGRVARAVTAKPPARAIDRVATALGDEYVVATDVRLPEGRIVRNLVLGPYGLAVLNELPPPRATRHTGTSWEIHRPDGRWAPWENPLERAARDGERVRRWFASTERDYVVKVYSAVVSTEALPRTPTCAVVTAEQIPAWLASLPPARAITADRTLDLVEEIRALV
jgi:hypothetical protein